MQAFGLPTCSPRAAGDLRQSQSPCASSLVKNVCVGMGLFVRAGAPGIIEMQCTMLSRAILLREKSPSIGIRRSRTR